MIPVGLSNSSNFLTGKYIGQQRIDLAKKISNLCMVMAFIWSIGTMMVVFIFEDGIEKGYTIHEKVQKEMSDAWGILIIFIFFDCMQGVSNGLVSGLRLISKVKYVSMCSYWIVGIPLSCVLMFYYDLRLAGLWWGPTAACILNYAAYTYYIQSADWQEISDKVQATLKKK